jgi:hypothetical protein
MAKLIREAADAGTLTGSRMEITLITPGWGSSGHYSAEVLAKAATENVFPRGTQMHIDHMGESERYEKPAGSVATLAAALDEDARWEPNWVDPKTGTKGRLVAESRVFSKWRDQLADSAEFIGVSIAAAAEVSMGEAEGRKGRIVESLLPDVLNRVDFVTVAGRGGKITEVLESAKVEEARNVGAWLEARMHSGFTQISDDMYGDGRLTREERITLSGALGEALQAFTARVEADAPQLFERDLWQEPEATASVGEQAPTSSPADPAGVTTNQEEATMATIDDAELKQLREAASRATALEAENETLKTENGGLKESGIRSQAEAIVAEAFGDIDAKATRKALVTAAVAAEAFNAEALAADAKEAAAEYAVAHGAGRVHGVGTPPRPSPNPWTWQTLTSSPP